MGPRGARDPRAEAPAPLYIVAEGFSFLVVILFSHTKTHRRRHTCTHTDTRTHARTRSLRFNISLRSIGLLPLLRDLLAERPHPLLRLRPQPKTQSPEGRADNPEPTAPRPENTAQSPETKPCCSFVISFRSRSNAFIAWFRSARRRDALLASVHIRDTHNGTQCNCSFLIQW